MTDTVPEAATDGAKKAHEYGRPASIEDASNKYFIHPLSTYIVKISIKLGLTPNFISLLGLACGLLAGYLYYRLPEPSYVFGAFAAMVCWHILDGADGRLARETGQTSAFGRIIDGVCDHLVFAAVYIAFALYLTSNGYSDSVWWLMAAAGLSHGVQAAGYEERRQKYQRRRDGLQRDVQEKLLVIDGKKSFLASFYDAVQRLAAGGDYGLDAKLAELRSGSETKQIAANLINKTAPMVRAWGLLNANNRTGLLFLCALLGMPILYFAIEIVLFNILLVVLIVAERKQEHKLIAEADKAGSQ